MCVDSYFASVHHKNRFEYKQSRYDCVPFILFSRYPWGQEAFDKAKREDKPIFLSGEKLISYFSDTSFFAPRGMFPVNLCLISRQWGTLHATGVM